MTTGIVIIDHGSRSAAANDLLLDLTARFARRVENKYAIIEPAHMEFGIPTLEQAFARCVARGADHVIIAPFFLAPGKHLSVDIPQLAADAAHPFPCVSYQIAPPLGGDDLILRLIEKRIHELPAPVQSERHYDPTH